ncbi:hypothetical protein HYU09_03380 [Candidatus Woesearchaeota archaeon]|nr:hypothetical protein [Candidatus Woesearchaeota archaeon]
MAVPPKEVLENVSGQIAKETQKHISYISSTSFSNMISSLQEVHESAAETNEGVVAVLRGKNIQKHLFYLFKNAKREILIPSSEAKEHSDFLDDIKNKQKNIKISVFNEETNRQKSMPRMCVVDEDVVIFPVEPKDTHPDYNLGIWIKHKNLASFSKKLLSA